MTLEKKKEQAVRLLQEKTKELHRLPKKDDFDEVTRSQIKAFLGPWPRALETADLKEKCSKATKPKRRKKSVKAQKGENK